MYKIRNHSIYCSPRHSMTYILEQTWNVCIRPINACINKFAIDIFRMSNTPFNFQLRNKFTNTVYINNISICSVVKRLLIPDALKHQTRGSRGLSCAQNFLSLRACEETLGHQRSYEVCTGEPKNVTF